MGDPLTLKEKLEKPEHNNWFKAVLILRELKAGISSFVEVRCREAQEDVLRTVLNNLPPHVTSVPQCTTCTSDSLHRNRACPQNVCPFIRQEINKIHRNKHIQLSCTDVSAWTDTSRCWEFAKAFIMGEGYRDKRSAADTDCAGLLSIIINCVWIHTSLTTDMVTTPTVFHDVKKLRNEVMHSPDNRISDALLQDLIKACVQILDEPKILATAIAARERTKEIEEMLLTVSNVDYPSVFLEVEENLRQEMSEMKTTVTVLGSNMSEQEQKVIALAGKQTSQAKDISNIAGKQTSQAKDISNIAGKQTSQENDISDIAGKQTSQAKDISNIAGKQTSQAKDISDIAGKQTSQAKDISDIAGKQTSQENDISDIAGKQTSQAKDISDIAGKQTSQEKDISDIAGKQTSQAKDMSNIAGKQTSQAKDISDIAWKQKSQDKVISDLTKQQTLQGRQLKADAEMEERIMSADEEAVQLTLEEHRQQRDQDRRIVIEGQVKLKKSLLKRYRDEILQEKPNVWFSMKNVLQMVVPLDIREDLEEWMALSKEDRKKVTTSKAKKGTKIKSRREIFFKRSEKKRMKEIYLLGEAGVGKSTFCHQLIDNWCKVQDTDSNDDYLRELKSFTFLFFIQARDAKKSQSVYEMIKAQNCPLQFHSILEEVFKSHPDNCLVLIDGLDEWQSDTRRSQQLPKVTDIEGSTILITSRQWKIEALDCDLPPSCRVLENRGLDSDGIENLAGKALEAFTNEDWESQVKPFLDQIKALKLDNLAKIPLFLLILIRSWVDGKRKLENARGFIYSGLIESLLIHSDKTDKNVEELKTWGDSSNPNILPMCFSGKDIFLDYNLLLNGLARLAYDDLFSAEKENTLVIRNHNLAKQPTVKEHLQICLKLGLLIESKDFSETKERCRAFSFPHKTIQEFFCAVHLSGEEFETGLAKFCERVISPVDVFDLENVLVFLSGMNITRCKTLFDHICSIVFGRKFAEEGLYPGSCRMHDRLQKIENLAEQCRAERIHSVSDGSHTGESQLVILDMVVNKDTPEHKVEKFCQLGPNIKSLVYYCYPTIPTVTPFSVVESVITMQYIQRLGIVCTVRDTKKYIVCICKYLSNLDKLESFSFSVLDRIVRLPGHVSRKLVSKLGTLPNLASVHLQRIDLSGINRCTFASQLKSLGLCATELLPQGVMSGWCNQLHTLNMVYVNLSPAAVHQLCQYVSTSSSLQTLMLSPSNGYLPTVFDDELDLTSHTSLDKLLLGFIDLKSGVRINPGHNWSSIQMNYVSMSESMWHKFILELPTATLLQLDVELHSVKSLNTQTRSDIRKKFCVTKDSIECIIWIEMFVTDSDMRDIHFNTKHRATD